jgi:hypothetical protein
MPRPIAVADLRDQLTEAEFWGVIGRLEHEQLDFKLRPDGLDEVPSSRAWDHPNVGQDGDLERETGLEPATSTLGRWHSAN